MGLLERGDLEATFARIQAWRASHSHGEEQKRGGEIIRVLQLIAGK